MAHLLNARGGGMTSFRAPGTWLTRSAARGSSMQAQDKGAHS